jgi:MoxR-like ATPase
VLPTTGEEDRVTAIENDAPRRSFSDWYTVLADNVAQVVHGKPDVIDLALVCLFAQGHLLVEDVPGVGKTTLAKALARSIDGTFGRIQFTPDLLPSDVVGVNVWNRPTGTFEFRPGPIFANVVVADEINRASPKTQSALLEAMAERQVTVDGTTHRLERPFVVLATENPIEHEGTYPLPDSQLDRFAMRISMGYPEREAEIDLLAAHDDGDPLDGIEPVLDTRQMAVLCDAVGRIEVATSIRGYLVAIAEATRQHPAIELGMSPRATLALQHTARAYAATRGRSYVIPDDVRDVAVPVVAHRVIPTAQAQAHGDTPAQVLDEIIGRMPVPTGVHSA